MVSLHSCGKGKKQSSSIPPLCTSLQLWGLGGPDVAVKEVSGVLRLLQGSTGDSLGRLSFAFPSAVPLASSRQTDRQTDTQTKVGAPLGLLQSYSCGGTL